jgi:hypothetical protein
METLNEKELKLLSTIVKYMNEKKGYIVARSSELRLMKNIYKMGLIAEKVNVDKTDLIYVATSKGMAYLNEVNGDVNILYVDFKKRCRVA